MSEHYLDEALSFYKRKDYYPYHMPGHKGNPLSFPEPYSIDITEIEGFDNLYACEGILKEAQHRAARLYGARDSFFLINGSTCGILCAVSTCIPRGSTLLMGRNSHKSAYYSAYLRQLHTRYVMPQITDFNIQGSIDPEAVSLALKKNPAIKAVFITSPTYDGIISDIYSISKITHMYHIPLIVDEAHGAHFRFSEKFPASALDLGADIVIHSLHKTLPSFTQTALLHVNSNHIDLNELKAFLKIYQTSSPSYVLMAGIDRCIRFLAYESSNFFHRFTGYLSEFYDKCMSLKYVHVYPPPQPGQKNCFDKDISKILISVRDNLMSGEQLYRLLLNKYHLQMEMFSGHYVTALMSVMDKKEGFDRLYQALEEIDASCPQRKPAHQKIQLTSDKIYSASHQQLSISQALESSGKDIFIQKSLGQISREYIYLYPPGIPLIVPGEIISHELLTILNELKTHNLSIHGLSDPECQRINIVNL